MQNALNQSIISLDANSFKDPKSHPLQLSFILQSTLNLYELMKRFHQELKNLVNYQSFNYHHAESKNKFEVGKLQYYQARYQLKIENTSLGEIVLSKNIAFTQEEIHTLENILVFLLMPLRNALAYEHAIRLSMIDPLTHLCNRQAFDMTLQREIEFAKRHQNNLSLLIVDIDFFKQINDTYGHQAGDLVLVEFAERLRQIHRQSDMIFRYGGEEFTLILAHTEHKGAVQVAERICQKTAEIPFIIKQRNVTITVSIGVSTHQGAESNQKLFSRADIALYTAKAAGRNQVKCSN
ncbi:GGDEF domain-containing protein [Candidatus Berkiella cookevillensis]|uniref:diguanylate cyclase n=1 Tax=Candidatus Berkiella cookevillensis TaxID=437022 RepID=A0A0Q9YAZ0_9GAMM|nr:GGDEF domain-containing protein [Candidatus Berkiella cookevillensis]MCS5709057.1 GGDEF domain-containing protein [Candidatus Berkiella cookevillensis]